MIAWDISTKRPPTTFWSGLWVSIFPQYFRSGFMVFIGTGFLRWARWWNIRFFKFERVTQGWLSNSKLYGATFQWAFADWKELRLPAGFDKTVQHFGWICELPRACSENDDRNIFWIHGLCLWAVWILMRTTCYNDQCGRTISRRGQMANGMLETKNRGQAYPQQYFYTDVPTMCAHWCKKGLM